jgi:glycosyltransferase involved in cell wall biosynthesis
MSEFSSFDVVHSYLMRAIPSIADIGQEMDVATVVTLNAYFGVCPKNDLLYKDMENCTQSSVSRCMRCISVSARKQNQPTLKHALVLYGNLIGVQSGRRKFSGLDACRAPTEHVRDNYATHGFPGEKIQIIPHMLDESFQVEHTSAFEPPYRLLSVGYLEPWKGVNHLVPLIERLRDRGIDVQLTVIGDGSCREELETQTAEHNLQNVVSFCGRVPNEELPEIYAAHDLFVYMGTWDEPLGRVYLEALASGTPIITTSYGTIEKVIGGGGEAVQPDVAAFVCQIEGMIGNGLESYSTAGTKQASNYLADKIIPQMESLYRGAIERKEQRIGKR